MEKNMSDNLANQIENAEKKWLAHWKQGPTRLRWGRTPLQVGDAAPDFALHNTAGETVHLRDFWKNGPAVLLFWRHYGCSCGFERAERLKKEYEQYVEMGATVVAIGQGEPERSAHYAKERGLPCTILSDPSLKVFETYDLLEGKPSQILFDAPDEFLFGDYEAGVELLKSRSGTDRALVDSPWQLPGEMVIDQQGIIQLAYRYQFCEDYPDPLVLIAAIKEAKSI